MRKVILFLSAVLFSNTIIAGDVELLPESRGFEIVFFNGPIIVGDAAKVAAAFAKAKPTTSHLLMLNSPGGSVREAMKIGDYLESNEVGVLVPAMMSCKSSCVLVLAGGDSKSVNGKIGIHRPFITDLEADSSTAAATLLQAEANIRSYLEKKGVAPSLVEDMFSIEPHKMQILTSREVTRYRLDQKNYLKQEETDISIARSLGLTRQQYIEKQARLNAECSKYVDMDQRMNCINAIMGTNLK
jgi:hypothetical protein